MAANLMNKAAAAPSRLSLFHLSAVCCMLAILSVLFWRSFHPDFVHFANDGPLGQQAAAQSSLPEDFAGAWSDLNDVGSN